MTHLSDCNGTFGTFKNGPSKIWGRQLLKNLKGYVWSALSRPYFFKFFKVCIPQILLCPFLNTLSHLFVTFKEYSLLKRYTKRLAPRGRGLPSHVFKLFNDKKGIKRTKKVSVGRLASESKES